MILGTHNSGTSSKLVWWQRLFAPILHLTSRCQDKTIKQQLDDGVRLFNLQITNYKGNWVFSHGLCIYTQKVLEVLELMKQYATRESPVYFQLILDKNFILGQKQEEFIQLVSEIKKTLCCPYFVMLYAHIEGTNKFPHKSSSKISYTEYYWTLGWASLQDGWINKIPLPKRHAKKYNKTYKDSCNSTYLMLDFYQIN